MLPKTLEEWWVTILRFLRFIAKLPVALLVLTTTVFLSFVVFMLLFRVTQWLWVTTLSKPWP